MNIVNEWRYNDYSKQFETYKPSAAKRAAHEAAKTARVSKSEDEGTASRGEGSKRKSSEDGGAINPNGNKPENGTCIFVMASDYLFKIACLLLPTTCGAKGEILRLRNLRVPLHLLVQFLQSS